MVNLLSLKFKVNFNFWLWKEVFLLKKIYVIYMLVYVMKMKLL